MTKFIILIVIAITTVSFFGCSDNPDEPTKVNAEVSLDGSWISNSGGYPFTVKDETLTVYADQGEELEERYFSLEIGTEKVTQPNNLVVRKIDRLIEKYAFTPLTDARVNMFNANATWIQRLETEYQKRSWSVWRSSIC